MNGKINIDDLFKAAFEDFEAQPSPEMLDNILGDAFDVSVQSSFDDFTLTPSIHIWENITDSLPTEADKLISTSFDEFAVTPPAHLWNNINDSIPAEADKILSASFDDFAVTPPAHLWQNISESIPSEVDQLLASSFNDFEATPPVGMWASIQGELDVEENFDAKFQEAFAGFEPKPSEHILNNLLSNKFDTGVRRAFMRHEVTPQEAVWDRIKPYIRFGPTIQRHLPTIRRMAAVILCLFLFTFLINQYKEIGTDVATTTTPPKTTSKTNINTPTTTIPAEDKAEQPLESIYEGTTDRVVFTEQQSVNSEAVEERVEEVTSQFISQSFTKNNEKSPFNLGGSSSLPPASAGNNDITLLSPTYTKATAPIENERTDNISSIPSTVSGLDTYAPSIIISNPNLSDFDQLEVSNAAQGRGNEYIVQSNLMDIEEDSDLAKMMLSYKGAYISASYSHYNSWILNDAVRDGLTDPGQELIDYVMSLGKSFGVGMGYQFTPNFGIETEFLRSNLSQSYQELTTSVVSNKSFVDATYFYVPLSLKYQVNRLSSMNKRIPRTLSAVWGMHYGRLQSEKLDGNRDIEVGTEDYLIQQELGVFTGADYHFYLSPNVHFTMGLRAAIGTDFQYLSAPFAAGTPYNVQVGGRLGLNYRFATRKYKWSRGIY